MPIKNDKCNFHLKFKKKSFYSSHFIYLFNMNMKEFYFLLYSTAHKKYLPLPLTPN